MFSTALCSPEQQRCILFFSPLKPGIFPQVQAFSYWTFEKNIQHDAVCTKLVRTGYLVAALINHPNETWFIFSCNHWSLVSFSFLAVFFSPLWQQDWVECYGINKMVFTLFGVNLQSFYSCSYCRYALTLSQKDPLYQLGGSSSLPAFPADISFEQQHVGRLSSFKHRAWP